jgi:hypothetical protein
LVIEMGVVIYNPGDISVETPKGFHYGREWRYYEDRRGLTSLLESGQLVEVGTPERDAPLDPGAAQAFADYWADEDAAKEEEEQNLPEEADSTTSKRAKSKVRDTSHAKDSAEQKEA